MIITEEMLFDIACIIDNEFRPSRKKFTARRIDGYNYLSTNTCDWSSLIKVYHDYEKISYIERIGTGTEGWQQIRSITMKRVNEYLKQKED